MTGSVWQTAERSTVLIGLIGLGVTAGYNLRSVDVIQQDLLKVATVEAMHHEQTQLTYVRRDVLDATLKAMNEKIEELLRLQRAASR